MKIREVNENKKQFIALLLLADEQENMIDRYLEKGTMYVLEDGNVKAECVVTDEDNGILEIKNIAVDPQNQGQGYGKALIDFLVSKYADEYSILQVGTGDSPLTVPFYEKCGFVRSHNIPNFFTDNYDHPIYECGVQLIDMVYLIVIGKPLISSRAFPPLHTVHATFTAHGVPSVSIFHCLNNQPLNRIKTVVVEIRLNRLHGSQLTKVVNLYKLFDI